MSEKPNLRLVKPSNEPADVLPFERRTELRKHAAGRVTAVTTQYNRNLEHRRIFSLVMCDMSTRGMGVWSQEQVEPGTELTLFLPPHGNEGGFDISGTVVRCEPTHTGYNVGLRVHGNQAVA